MINTHIMMQNYVCQIGKKICNSVLFCFLIMIVKNEQKPQADSDT